MYIYIIQCTHYICSCNQPCLTLLRSCTLVVCNNYITTKINLITNQQLLCNKCMALSNTYDHATCIHFHHPIYMTFQLKIWNLKIWNLGKKPLNKWQWLFINKFASIHQQLSFIYAYGFFFLLLKVESSCSYS